MADERRIPGACTCGRSVTKIENSTCPTSRRDGARFVYTERTDDGWCIFRCEDCLQVIDEQWKPNGDFSSTDTAAMQVGNV